MKTPTFALLILLAGAARAAELFPFVLPWDDASPSLTNVSTWIERPAGKGGFVSVKDGHLFAAGKRLRIFGVNLAFGANFPTHADAEKVAARMAKFGINCVRFHHMDMMAAPDGIWASDMRTLDTDQLDRLDYFISELKKNGVYADLNLHVSRTYPDRPKSEKVGNPNFDAGVDNFSAPMIALQKDYARALLTHVNAYTHNAYVDEPAVALIEINNENALLNTWHNGGLDNIAAPYREELGALWMKWLGDKYGTDDKRAVAWSVGQKAAGPEVLKNGDFSKGLDGWYAETHEGAKATTTTGEGGMRVVVSEPGKASWHVQFTQGGIALAANETYAVTFRARADAKRELSINLGQAHDPWKILDSDTVLLSPEWKTFTILLKTKDEESAARLGVTGLGAAKGTFEFSDFSLHISALEASAPVGPFTKRDCAGRTPAAQQDWFAFLWSQEEKYWPAMYAFIRKELGAKNLLVGTQLGWSPFPIQSAMDVIDSHSYWQHPDFHGKGWNADDWSVKNVSMAGREDGGTIPGLALQRVEGKPYICTEYNHAAPNEYGAETFPLICAYAALEDWDGIFAFAYSHRRDDWDKRYFPSFFDIDQHPVKMATLPASLAIFIRGDVKPGKEVWVASTTATGGMELARRVGPRVGADALGMPRPWALTSRVGIRLADGRNQFGEALSGASGTSDTGELSWNHEHHFVTVDAAKSKSVIGNVGARTFELSDVRIAAQGPWAAIQATVIDGKNFKTAKRILLTATGLTANTDMKWTSNAHESVGRNWGRAPSLVEGIAAKITLPNPKLKAWALDERGQRGTEVPMNGGSIEIGPQYRTLWYELASE